MAHLCPAGFLPAEVDSGKALGGTRQPNPLGFRSGRGVGLDKGKGWVNQVLRCPGNAAGFLFTFVSSRPKRGFAGSGRRGRL